MSELGDTAQDHRAACCRTQGAARRHGEFYNFLLKSAGRTAGHSAAAQKGSSLAFDFQIKYRETGRSHKRKRMRGGASEASGKTQPMATQAAAASSARGLLS